MKEIVVDIVRPVNPSGMSFVKYVYGAIASVDREIIEKYKKELSKLVQRLSIKIEEAIGSSKIITGKIVLYVEDDKKPVKMVAKDISVWEPVKEVSEEIEASL